MGMWIVKPDITQDGERLLQVVHIDSIVRARTFDTCLRAQSRALYVDIAQLSFSVRTVLCEQILRTTRMS